MEGLRTKVVYIGTGVKSAAENSYETVNNGSWKTLHFIHHVSIKGGENKGRNYTSTYIPGTDRNKTAKIQG